MLTDSKPVGKNAVNNIAELYKQAGLESLNLDDTMNTPYGPPSVNAFIIPVPNETVGLIIGKNGETIRTL